MHPRPAGVDLVACSREGAGLGDGLALLFFACAAVVAVAIVVAVVSGAIVGKRKGQVSHQVLVHLLWATAIVMGVPIVIGAGFGAFAVIQYVLMARDTVVNDAWLAPLRQPAPGEFDRAMLSVMNAKDADAPARRIILIDVLPSELEKLDVSLNERERVALEAAARQLRTENVERKLGSHPSNLERLDGAVMWFTRRPDLAGAMRACGERRECAREVLDSAERWCWNRGTACLAAMTPERVAAAGAMFGRDTDDLARVKGLPARAAAAVERERKIAANP
jgi:hypothetical protein